MNYLVDVTEHDLKAHLQRIGFLLQQLKAYAYKPQ